ncbi:MAG: hypothetical protein HY815_17590 [Candidatus Riflebacteria bacterium]|nr:hypothetical protein [Candidatus Riflebacteria bacterium]
MRLQDEFTALYPIADGPTRRYILGQVPRLPVHFDSEDLEELLDRGHGEADPKVAARRISVWLRPG